MHLEFYEWTNCDVNLSSRQWNWTLPVCYLWGYVKPGYKDNLQSIPEQKDEFILVINNSETNYFEMSLKISTKNWTELLHSSFKIREASLWKNISIISNGIIIKGFLNSMGTKEKWGIISIIITINMDTINQQYIYNLELFIIFVWLLCNNK